jgi:hypothetical protein
VTKKLLSWDIIEAGCLEVSKQLADSNIDIIIAISRGGLIPARLIANHLQVSKILSVGVTTYAGDKKSGDIDVYQEVGDTLKQKKLIAESNVLVIDDLSDTGDTFAYVLMVLCEKIAPRSIKTASLYVKPDAKYVPDVYFQKLKTKPWLVFPWEFQSVNIDIQS